MGKTGTSQKYDGNGIASGKFISSFIGTFPADNPKYVILVVVDEPTSGAYYGSIVATPYAKMVLEGIIDYKNISPSGDIASETSAMALTVKMPSLTGMSLSKAVSILANLGLQYELDGDGGTIKSQFPQAGTMLYKRAMTLITT